MAFGDIIRSFPAPGNVASKRAIGWDGTHITANDDTASAVIVVEVGSLQTIATLNLGGIVYPGDRSTGPYMLAHATGLLVDEISLYFDQGSARNTNRFVYQMVGPSFPTNMGVARFEPGVVIINETATFNRYGSIRDFLPTGTPGDKPWARLIHSSQPQSYNTVGAAGSIPLAHDGHFFYTACNSPFVLNKHDGPPNYSLVRTAAPPAQDVIEGMAFDGSHLWVGIGGAIDKIYVLSVY